MREKIIISIILLFLPISSTAQEIFLESNNLYSTEQIRILNECSPGSNLIISSPTTLKGEINISIAKSDSIIIDYHKKAKTDKKTKAIDFIDLISVKLIPIKNGYTLELRAPNPAPWNNNESALIELDIQLPEVCNIEIDGLYYDVFAQGPFNDFIVSKSLGRLSVEFVNGSLELITSNRKLNVSNVYGDVNLSTTNSTIYAANIESPNSIIRISNEGGDINARNIIGELNIRNKFGRIDITECQPSGVFNKISSDNGPVIISITNLKTEQLLISNYFEDIELFLPNDISAEFSLAVEENSKIEVTNMIFKPDLVQSNRLNLISGDGKALISSSIRGTGNIYLEGINDDN